MVLADTADFKITHHRPSVPNGSIIVSFDNISSGLKGAGFGTDFALKQGFENIFVAQRRGSQYQGLSFEEFRDIVQPVTEGRKVFSYGSSLGAYAAVYYGGAINAKIVASAPKNSAHPSIGAKRFADLPFTHREISQNQRSELSPIVIYDPHRLEDVAFIETCVRPAYPDGEYLQFPFAGHTVLETMQMSGELSKFSKGVFIEEKIPAINLKTEGSFVYHCEHGRYLRRHGRFDEAEEHLRKSLDLKVSSVALENLMHILMKQKRSAELISVSMECIDRCDSARRPRLVSEYMKGLVRKFGFEWDVFCLSLK